MNFNPLSSFALQGLDIRLFAASAATLVHLAGSAQSTAEPTAYTCNVGSEIRLVSISYGTHPEGGGCEVIYEKRTEGQPPKAIWRAKNDLNFCASKLLATVGKLSAGGWQCVADGQTGAPQAMSTPDADKVLPPKNAPAEKTEFSTVAATPSSESSNSLPLKQQPVKKTASAKFKSRFDDWIFRWDSERKELVFTLYDSREPSKIHKFSWAHADMAKTAASPSNIVLALDENDNQVLIIAWPGEQSQHITVLDPLFQEEPVCEIETESIRDSGWNYVVENKKLYLTGMKARNGDKRDLVEFKKPCTYVR